MINNVNCIYQESEACIAKPEHTDSPGSAALPEPAQTEMSILSLDQGRYIQVLFEDVCQAVNLRFPDFFCIDHFRTGKPCPLQ